MKRIGYDKINALNLQETDFEENIKDYHLTEPEQRLREYARMHPRDFLITIGKLRNYLSWLRSLELAGMYTRMKWVTSWKNNWRR